MNIRFISFIIGFLFTFNLQAQDAPPTQRFNAGLLFGLNLSQIDGDKLAGYNQPGLNAGLEVSTPINEKFDASLEFLFSQKGAHKTPNDSQSANITKMRLNYVEVPVLINFYDWKLRFSAGGSYARMINYTVVDALGRNVSALEEYDFKQNVFSVIVGVTYFINDHWGVAVRWSAETNIRVDPGATKYRGKNLMVRMMYQF